MLEKKKKKKMIVTIAAMLVTAVSVYSPDNVEIFTNIMIITCTYLTGQSGIDALEKFVKKK